MTEPTTEILAHRAEKCADGECTHARSAAHAVRIAGQYRYGVEEALDYLDDRDGITPEVAATLRGILQRAIETPVPSA